MGYGDDDLSSFEKSRLGINPAHSVYLVRNSLGDVVSIKAVDHVGNRENVIDLRSPMHREGQSSVVEAVKMVYGGLRRLPQNYIVVMAPSGQLSRGTLSGASGYSSGESKRRNAERIVGSVMGNPSALESFRGGNRKRVSSDAYGPGEGASSYFSDGEGYGKSPKEPKREKIAGGAGKKKDGLFAGPVAGKATGFDASPSDRTIAELMADLAFSEQKRLMNEALSLKRKGARVNYSDTFAEDLSDTWEASVF